MSRNIDHRNTSWPLKSRVANTNFSNYDFTGTNFNSAIFENVNFDNCTFDKCLLTGSKIFYDSSFSNCIFINTDLSKTTFGSHNGLYHQCQFIKCNVSGKEFNHTRFTNCIFDRSKLKKINFNASSFKSCKFIGKIEDVTFNGMYDTNKSEFPTLESTDFSASTLGEFVTFIQCDLSNSIPPEGTSFESILYQLYADDPLTMSTGSKDRMVIRR